MANSFMPTMTATGAGLIKTIRPASDPPAAQPDITASTPLPERARLSVGCTGFNLPIRQLAARAASPNIMPPACHSRLHRRSV